MFAAMSDLGTYLKNHGIRQADFAAAIGATQATVSKLIAGGRPSLSLAVSIERATGGAVAASSWIPDTALPSSQNLSSAEDAA